VGEAVSCQGGRGMSFRLELPLPPSLNTSYRNVAGVGRVKTNALKNWRKDATGYYLLAKRDIQKVSGPFNFWMRVPESMRGDISNRGKAAEDFLVSMQAIPDDKYCKDFRITRSPEVREHFCLIEVEAV
jgi:Holliday junction resolvase RusA-like endonuclease